MNSTGMSLSKDSYVFKYIVQGGISELSKNQTRQLRGKSTHKIGSYGIGRINFDPKDHFFRLTDNMRMVKEVVNEIIDPDILGIKKPRWNQSSSTKPPARSDHSKALFNIRVGFEDSKVTATKPKFAYPGCDNLRSDYTGSQYCNYRMEYK